MLFNRRNICRHWFPRRFSLKISVSSFTSGLREKKGCQAVCHKQNLYSGRLEREQAEGGALSSTLNKDNNLQSLLVVPTNKKPKWQENQHSQCLVWNTIKAMQTIPCAIKRSKRNAGFIRERARSPAGTKSNFATAAVILYMDQEFVS